MRLVIYDIVIMSKSIKPSPYENAVGAFVMHERSGWKRKAKKRLFPETEICLFFPSFVERKTILYSHLRSVRTRVWERLKAMPFPTTNAGQKSFPSKRYVMNFLQQRIRRRPRFR